MSSPLDNRIRHIAREEASGMFTNPAAGVSAADANTDRVAELEKEVADLRTRLENLENSASTPTPKRTARKTTETTE